MLYHTGVLRKPTSKPSEALAPAEAHRRINKKELMELVGVKCHKTLRKRVREGKLPPPRYLAPRQPRWVFGEVLDALERVEVCDALPPESGAWKVLARLGIKRR